MSNASTTRPLTGRHMALIFGSFFAVVFTANATMAVMAFRSWTGLVVENSYVASQEFNEKTNEVVKATDIGVQIKIANDRVIITLTDKVGVAVVAQSMVLKVGRPSYEGEDRSIPLIAMEKGSYSADHSLTPGQWSGTITAKIAGQKDWSRPVYLLVKG